MHTRLHSVFKTAAAIIRSVNWDAMLWITCISGFSIALLLAGPIYFFYALVAPYQPVDLDKKQTGQFIRELERYEKIWEISSTERTHIRLNGETFESQEDDRYLSYLKQHSIDVQIAHRFEAFLRESKLGHYRRSDELHVFIVGGSLDNRWGYIYVDRSKVKTEELAVLVNTNKWQALGDGWFRFAS